MDKLYEDLQQLVAEAVSYPRKSLKRRQKLNQIIRTIIKSGKLWRENTHYYNDALQQTWLYLCKNIDKYDSSRGSVITWLDYYLKRRLQDCRIAKASEQARSSSNIIPGTDQSIDLVAQLPAKPDISPILEETRQWVENDPTGELRNIHIKNRPDVTCQILILRRLPPETPWKDIAQEFSLPPSTPPNFYKRECLPQLRKFAAKQGYL